MAATANLGAELRVSTEFETIQIRTRLALPLSRPIDCFAPRSEYGTRHIQLRDALGQVFEAG